MKIIQKFWPVMLFVFVTASYFWQVIFKNLIPFPGDILVGAYLPWYEYKWGTITGVPFKANSSTPDIYSQFYLWKSLIAQSWKHFQFPLWNPYSYSGYPLLANYHSGALYPFNLFQVLFNESTGWSALIIFGVIGSLITMFLLLRQFQCSKPAACIGAFTYAFSGFAICWSQFINAPQALVWFPLLILVIDKYFAYNKPKYLFLLPFIFYLFFTSGHFQITSYGAIVITLFTLWKLLPRLTLKKFFLFCSVLFMTVGLSAIQILPTFEMATKGIRFDDHAITSRNYGLSPLRNVINLFAPDFFENPVTGNFWGFFNYHETIFYSGLITILLFISAIFLWKKLRPEIKFFWIIAFTAILLGFDTPLGKAIYLFKIPGLSTSDAGRIAALFTFGSSIVVAGIIDTWKTISLKTVIKITTLWTVILSAIWIIALNSNLGTAARHLIAQNNMIFPSLLFIATISTLVIFRKKHNLLCLFLGLIIIADLFRFGWKYTAFVPQTYLYPKTPITDYLTTENSKDIFRIDREKAEIMPNSTWMAYRLMSPSGYDPMALKDYVLNFEKGLNNRPDSNPSRYSEIDNYSATQLASFNVKYLLVVKRDKIGRTCGDVINSKIDLTQWTTVFQTKCSAILQNNLYQSRVRFIDSTTAQAKILSYSPNTVKISYQNGLNNTLLLADTWYPGWVATVNQKPVPITQCEGIFRCITLPDNSGMVTFDYQPASFWLGFKISLISLIITILALFITSRHHFHFGMPSKSD